MASTSAKWRKRSNLRVAQSVKQRVPSQIGIWCGADVVERGAIRGKRRKPSIERGVIFDRRDCEVWGPAEAQPEKEPRGASREVHGR